jgi:hypothetical protein
MRRLAINGLTICAIMMMSGCCIPNLFCPYGSGGRGWGGFGCPNGRCGIQQGLPPITQGCNPAPGMIQTSYPGGPIIQQQGPIAFQPTPIAFQQPIPTMALESLPTYR